MIYIERNINFINKLNLMDFLNLFEKVDVMLKKLLLVIRSINSQEQIPATRKYIDLWYKKYGTKNKELIEIYFKSKKQDVR